MVKLACHLQNAMASHGPPPGSLYSGPHTRHHRRNQPRVSGPAAGKQQGLLSCEHVKGWLCTQDIQHGITDLPINIQQAAQTPPVEGPQGPRNISTHTTPRVKNGGTPNGTPIQ